MPLFQNTIVKKYVQSIDKPTLDAAYNKYNAYFHNATIQNNIKEAKEEQFQEGFLRELFGTILGYTLNPNPDYNLTTELKNISNSKKVDGAIIFNGKAVAVIELKGTDTTDLAKIETQAFGYKNNQPECIYVITSNFEKLRFYIDNAIDFIEFNLFTLTKEEFALLYLCLCKTSIEQNIPKHIKDESVSKENNITNQLYKDYSAFKRALFTDIVEKNPQYDKLLLFKKTQKLLDRFLFIFFAEDRLLLPTNLIRRINLEWDNLQKMRMSVSLYERYKMYFNDLNAGANVTLPAFGKKTGDAIEANFEIFAYNGGLFQPDEVLDVIHISDALLYEHTHKLSDYNFESEVDVNILGHIFENSLNEIDEIKTELEGGVLDKTKTKRKKDGVFYTPKYITKYIVENTIGKLCAEKKEALQLNEDDYSYDKKKTTQKEVARKKELLEKLDTYRNWLLQLTICDPACGSGAFLNQALEFLIAEHRYLDELKAKVLGDSLVLSDIENSILENNLYGIDLNDESTEIAKLSLWLRTARRNRKLNSLSNNIKCGNSLIDDPAVAGDKAFNWEKEFPHVFAKGGFDVVIGNPPYGIFMDKKLQEFYTYNFPLTSYKINLYVLFIERMINLLKKGTVHFIIPKSLLFNTYYEKIRRELLVKTQINEILTINEEVFADAEVGGSLLIKFSLGQNNNLENVVNLISAEKVNNFLSSKGLIKNDFKQSHFLKIPNCEISITNKDSNNIHLKINQLKPLKEYFTLKNGLNPGNIKDILITNVKASDKHKKIIWGKDISKYYVKWSNQYINYDTSIGQKISISDIKSKEGMNKQNKIDFALRNPALFEVNKIIIRKTGDSLIAALDINKFYFDTLVHGIYQKSSDYSLESLLCILNSKPATLIYRMLHDIKGKVFAKISLDNLESFPFPKINNDNKLLLEEMAKKMIIEKESFEIVVDKFTTYFSSQYKIEKLSNKLEKWYDLEFVDFIKELNKAIKTGKGTALTKKDEFEWMELFEENKQKALALKTQIDQTDKEIDQMVYALYELTEEEIKIVEEA